MTSSPHHDSLSDISLLEYLREDDRPTIVFAEEDVKSPTTPGSQWALAYSNPAYNQFLILARKLRSSIDSDYAAFIHDVEMADSGRFDFAGHWWKVRYFLTKWRVVFCEDELDDMIEQSDTVSSPEPLLLKLPDRSKEVATLKRGPLVTSTQRRSDSSSSGETTPGNSTRALSTKSSISNFGEVRELIDWTQHDLPDLSAYIQMFKNVEWSSTPLGPMKDWPLVLRQVVVKMMSNPDPRAMIYGDHYTLLYNEACIPIWGAKHPQALGRSPSVAFAESWPAVRSSFDQAYREGKSTKINKIEVLIRRRNDMIYEEECFFSFVLVPILGADGRAIGVMDEFNEVTNETIAERRVRTIVRIGEGSASAGSLQEVWTQILKSLNENTHDVPFAMLYSVKNNEGEEFSSWSSEAPSQPAGNTVEKYCWLEGVVGIDNTNPAVVQSFPLAEGEGFGGYCLETWRRRVAVLIDSKAMPPGLVQLIPGRTPYTRAVVCAIQPVYGPNVVGFLVLGLNARRPFNDAYRDYIRLLNDRINACTAHIVLPKEQREAQAATEEAALRHASLTKQLLLRTQEAERGEANFMTIGTSAPFGMFLLKQDGSPAYLNAAFYELTGVTQDSMSQWETDFWAKTIAPEDLQLVRDAWEKMRRDRQPIVFEYRGTKSWTAIDKATGTEMSGPFWIRAMAFPEIDTTDDTIAGTQGWLENISLQKYTEQMQAKRLEEALEHKRQSEAFIDMTSHEIRNPLSAIVLSADSIITTYNENKTRDPMILSRDETEEIVNAAQTIILCANHQRKLCSDILTLSKLDSNLLSISLDKVDPVFLVQKALRMYAPEFQAAEIEATLDVDRSLEELMIGDVVVDPSRLLQVLINLLTNALKFTKDRPRKEITISISASMSPPTSDSHGVAFIKPRDTIRDKAPLSPEWEGLPAIYLQFAVEDTGRGLNDKEMEVLFRRFSQASPKTYGQYGGSGLGLFISRELTELQGGQIGVSSKANEGSTFAFYVQSLKLPGDPRSPTSTKMTFTGIPSTPTKDVTEQPMPGIVSCLLPLPNIPVPPTPTRTASAPPPTMSSNLAPPPLTLPTQALHILVVEDNLINQKILAQQLRRQGCTVSVANHGLEALSYIKTTHFALHPENDAHEPIKPPQPLSLILLDLEMPVMGGLECVRHIREMEKVGVLTGHIPTIAVTANARSEQIANALGHGMDLVVTKPFRIPALFEQIKALVAGTANATPSPAGMENRRGSIGFT